jgi:peptidoglycan/xylan/chitin deacetylase (PgdA/CDA1 family)
MTFPSALKSAFSRIIPLGLLSRLSAPVLTYHACYEKAPCSIAPIDNTNPQWLYDHLRPLKRRLRFVPIDELCESAHPNGLAAVTFDDGYQSVITQALPVMSALHIPFTVFVNTSALEGKILWRHKLIYAIENGLGRELAEHTTYAEDLYGAWKQPRNNSRLLEDRLNRVLLEHNVTLPNYLFDTRSRLIAHPLVSYGNHTHNHYVLSSLSCSEQHDEIRRAKQILGDVPGITVSQVFALPFGETHHANADTFAVLHDLGYRAILMNRGGVNLGRRTRVNGLTVVERFSPNEQDIRWQLHREFSIAVRRATRWPRYRPPYITEGVA